MFEAEIEHALEREDMTSVWLYMLKRTAWMQHTELNVDQQRAAEVSTREIAAKLQAKLAELQTKLDSARRHAKFTKVYDGGGACDGQNSLQKV